jgi:hypothetical protein
MDKTLIPGILSGIVALVAAGIAYRGVIRGKRADSELAIRVKQVEAQLAAQKAEADRRAEAERTARKFSEPLGRAAYDLQSRIYNMIARPDAEHPHRGRFLEVYLRRGDKRTRNYAAKNTLFLIAQYFAWTELARREIQFIDLGADKQTRKLAELQDKIYNLWQTDRHDPLLRIFAGEQRALGERLIRDAQRGPECMGYASFLDFYKANPDPLLCALESEILSLGTSLNRARPRLVAMQHALLDLLAFIDPQFVRFPERTRTKLEA